jgi:hypothetical protein
MAFSPITACGVKSHNVAPRRKTAAS